MKLHNGRRVRHSPPATAEPGSDERNGPGKKNNPAFGLTLTLGTTVRDQWDFFIHQWEQVRGHDTGPKTDSSDAGAKDKQRGERGPVDVGTEKLFFTAGSKFKCVAKHCANPLLTFGS